MSKKELQVKLDFRNGIEHNVGTLLIAETESGILFEYDRDFLKSDIQISPFVLPLRDGTFKALYDPDLYDLHHVFADALPDTWGKKIQDEEFEKIKLYNPTSLDRLAYIGRYGMGALRFEPSESFDRGSDIIEQAEIRKYGQSIINGNIENVPDELLQKGGSAGGTRPKFLIDYEPETDEMRYTRGTLDDSFRPVILKFSTQDSIGLHQRVEYSYAKMSSLAGIDTPRVYLPEKKDEGRAAFVIERFDIKPFGERLHMHTLAGMLGRNFRRDRVDYSDLIQVLDRLKAPKSDFIEAYRRIVFNHLAGNKDDHSKNFSFLMDSKGKWSLSPFYDMGFSKGNTHQMSLNGKFSTAKYQDLKKFAEDYEIDNYLEIIEKTCEALRKWKYLAKDNGIPEKYIEMVKREIHDNIKKVEKDMYKTIKGTSKQPEWFKYTLKGTKNTSYCYGLKQDPESSISITKADDIYKAWKRNSKTEKFEEITAIGSKNLETFKKIIEKLYEKGN